MTRPAFKPNADFGGLEYRRARPEQLQRAQRQTTRYHRAKRLEAKLDELLGSIDEGLPPDGWRRVVKYLLLLVLACSDAEAAARTLRSAGFRDIQVGGSNPVACGGDLFSNEFMATNPLGQRVHGVVCCGAFKGCTVRFPQ